jgi:hypothetical protein
MEIKEELKARGPGWRRGRGERGRGRLVRGFLKDYFM